MNENSKQLLKAIDKHGEDLHRNIDTIIKKLRANLDEMNSKHLAVLEKQEYEITRRVSDISQIIADLKKIKSEEFNIISSFKSRKLENCLLIRMSLYQFLLLIGLTKSSYTVCLLLY